MNLHFIVLDTEKGYVVFLFNVRHDKKQTQQYKKYKIIIFHYNILFTMFNTLRPNDGWIYASANKVIIGSDNGLLPVRHQPLSEPRKTYCQSDPEEQISMKFYLKFKSFHSRKCIWKCLKTGMYFVSAPSLYPSIVCPPLSWHSLAQNSLNCGTYDFHEITQTWSK